MKLLTHPILCFCWWLKYIFKIIHAFLTNEFIAQKHPTKKAVEWSIKGSAKEPAQEHHGEEVRLWPPGAAYVPYQRLTHDARPPVTQKVQEQNGRKRSVPSHHHTQQSTGGACASISTILGSVGLQFPVPKEGALSPGDAMPFPLK